MKTIDPSIVAALQSKEIRPFILLDMSSFGTSYVFTDCDVPILHRSATYGTCRFVPRMFSFSSVNYSASRIVSDTTVELDNTDDVATVLFDSTAQGKEVRISLVLVDSLGATLGTDAVELFRGVVDAWTLDEEKVSFTVVSKLNRWSKTTLNRHLASCRWKEFKGTECKYPGSETECDRSYARCSQLGNTANFGGFRWLPGLIGKEIWWGRKRGPQD